MNKRILGILILWAIGLSLSAQDASPTEQYLQSEITEHPFDKETWLKAKEGINFKDEMRVSREDEDFFDENENETRSIPLTEGGGSGSGILGFIFKGFLILAAIALLAYLLNQFLGAGGISIRKNRKIKHQPLEVDLEKIEEKLLESDVDRMLRLALEKENYPLALRLKYLAIIKGLYLNGYTRWKKDKTNRQYIREIEDPNRKKEFKVITLAYERVWYGQGEINKQDYASLEPNFSAFIKTIEANPITAYEPT